MIKKFNEYSIKYILLVSFFEKNIVISDFKFIFF